MRGKGVGPGPIPEGSAGSLSSALGRCAAGLDLLGSVGRPLCGSFCWTSLFPKHSPGALEPHNLILDGPAPLSLRTQLQYHLLVSPGQQILSPCRCHGCGFSKVFLSSTERGQICHLFDPFELQVPNCGILGKLFILVSQDYELICADPCLT